MVIRGWLVLPENTESVSQVQQLESGEVCKSCVLSDLLLYFVLFFFQLNNKTLVIDWGRVKISIIVI